MNEEEILKQLNEVRLILWQMRQDVDSTLMDVRELIGQVENSLGRKKYDSER